PYTSYLIVPDAPVPVVTATPGQPNVAFRLEGGAEIPWALTPAPGAAKPVNVVDFARNAQNKPGELSITRGKLAEDSLKQAPSGKGGSNEKVRQVRQGALEAKLAYDQAESLLRKNQYAGLQAGKLGVDLSVQSNNLRAQTRLTQTAQRNVAGRNCIEIG